MSSSPYLPIFELTRGNTVESIHDGAVVVMDAFGKLLASYGDPHAITFLRSTAKPFQALPFVQNGGPEFFKLSQREIAILCASHSGTDEHVSVVRSIQSKVGIDESELLCGIHYPSHAPTAEALRQRQEQPTPNRHNCSGKHTGMLAYTRLLERSGAISPENLPYISYSHPIQKVILETFAEMCDLSVDQVFLGVDGCSAPNFAVPLHNAALAYARLCDPESGHVAPDARVSACHKITTAMMAHPDMVAGPGRFDTRIMEVGGGRIISKGGAEGYQGLGLMPGVLSPNSPAVGIAIKVADGDARDKVRTAIALDVLNQLGALSKDLLDSLQGFGPRYPVYNYRKILTGQGYTTFTLDWAV